MWTIASGFGPARIRSAAIALLVGWASAASGQNAPPGVLTLQAAIDKALASNPTVAAARLRREIDLAVVGVARERPNPEATVELEKETPKQSFALAVPLELGGRRSKRIAVGEAALRAGDAEVAVTIAQLRNDVRRAYSAAVVAKEKLGLLSGMRDLAVRIRDAAQQRFDAGDVPRLEVLQAQLSLASAENEQIAAESSANAARAALNALLGQPLDTVNRLPAEIDSAADVTTEAAVQIARTSSLELLVLQRQVDEQRAKVSLAFALRSPEVTPSATLTRDAAPEFDYGWRASVTVTLPVFTTHRAGVAVEQATLDQLVAQKAATEQRIAGEVAAVALTVQGQRQLYLRYRDEIVPQAQQVEQLAEDVYRLGQSGITALLQALQATRDVRLRALDTAGQFQAAVADLERAIGAPLP